MFVKLNSFGNNLKVPTFPQTS